EFGPLEDFLNVFSELEFLISNKAKVDLESFIGQSHPFDELVEKFNYYQNLANHVMCDISRSSTVGMFEVNSERILDTLHERTQWICDVLVDQMLEDHLEANKAICVRYKEMSHTALTIPTNTNEYMALEAFMKKVKHEMLAEFNKELLQCNKRLVFLSDYCTFAPTTIRLNSEPFQWHQKVESILEENALIMAEKLKEL
ncbi:unnamed protein product, partial [Lymnaea stagnalis]